MKTTYTPNKIISNLPHGLRLVTKKGLCQIASTVHYGATLIYELTEKRNIHSEETLKAHHNKATWDFLELAKDKDLRKPLQPHLLTSKKKTIGTGIVNYLLSAINPKSM